MSKHLPHQPVPPSASQDAAPIPPGKNYPPFGAGQRYRNVLPHLLVGMFTGWIERPDTVDVVGEEATIDNWVERSGSGAEVFEEEDKEGTWQHFPEEEAR